MKIETPIQELLTVLDEIKNAQPEDFSPEALSIRACMDTVIKVIADRKLEEKSKQMVVNAHKDGFIQSTVHHNYETAQPSINDAKQYYANKYETE